MSVAGRVGVAGAEPSVELVQEMDIPLIVGAGVGLVAAAAISGPRAGPPGWQSVFQSNSLVAGNGLGIAAAAAAAVAAAGCTKEEVGWTRWPV